MAIKRFKIGVMSPAEMRERTIAIARGDYKPQPGEPKVWFPSLESVGKLLNNENRAMLRALAEAQPNSLSEAAKIVHRQQSNLTRTLGKMERYGIVKLVESKEKRPGRKEKRPVVQATDFEVRTFSIDDLVADKAKRERRAKRRRAQ